MQQNTTSSSYDSITFNSTHGYFGTTQIFLKTTRMFHSMKWYDLNKAKLAGIHNVSQLIFAEKQIAQKAKHDNLIELYDSVDDGQKTCLLYEHSKIGNLLQLFTAYPTLTKEHEAFYIFVHVFEGLTHLHNQHISHCNIHPSHVYTFRERDNKPPIFKLGNYRLAIDHSLSQQMSSLDVDVAAYRAPETFANSNTYSSSADLWSMGILYHWLLFRKTPWKNENNIEELQKEIAQFDINKHVDELEISANSKKILKMLLQQNPSHRQGLEHIKQLTLYKDYANHNNFTNLFDVKNISNEEEFRIIEKIYEDTDYGIHVVEHTTTGGQKLVKWYKISAPPQIVKSKGSLSLAEVTDVNDLLMSNKDNHPNLAKIESYHFSHKEMKLYFAFSYDINGGRLSQLLQANAIKECEAVEILQQMLQGINYLHENGVSNLGIKPDNVLIFHNTAIDANTKLTTTTTTYKLLDYSFLNTPSVTLSRRSCNVKYFPPELIKAKDKTGIKADYWALGITYYEMLGHKVPWDVSSESEAKKEDIEKNIAKFNLSEIKEDNMISVESKELLLGLMDTNPETRWDYMKTNSKIKQIKKKWNPPTAHKPEIIQKTKFIELVECNEEGWQQGNYKLINFKLSNNVTSIS